MPDLEPHSVRVRWLSFEMLAELLAKVSRPTETVIRDSECAFLIDQSEDWVRRMTKILATGWSRIESQKGWRLVINKGVMAWSARLGDRRIYEQEKRKVEYAIKGPGISINDKNIFVTKQKEAKRMKTMRR